MLDDSNTHDVDVDDDATHLARLLAPSSDLPLALLGCDGRARLAALALAAGDTPAAARQLHLLALQASRIAVAAGAAAEALELHAETSAPEPLQTLLGSLRAAGQEA